MITGGYVGTLIISICFSFIKTLKLTITAFNFSPEPFIFAFQMLYCCEKSLIFFQMITSFITYTIKHSRTVLKYKANNKYNTYSVIHNLNLMIQ